MYTSIFKIRSKFLHLEISSYLEKLSLLKIIKYSKKLQNFTDITLEDYEVYSIIQKNTLRKISLDEKEENEALKTIKAIVEYTDSNPLYADNTEIKVPTPIYEIIQLKDQRIIASTESSLLIILYDEKENQFFIIDNIPTNTIGAVIFLIDLGNNLLLTSTFRRQIKIFNLDNHQVINEIYGSCPLLLEDNKICYIWEDKEIRLYSNGYDKDSIKLKFANYDEDNDNNNEDFRIISSSIQLKNGNILLSCWDKTISEYDIKNKTCINIIKTNIEYIDTLCELKDGRIAFTANDNARIFIMKKKEKDKSEFLILNGHSNSVIKIIQLENEQLVSASYDGKIKFWVKTEYGDFYCSLTFFLSADYIRKIILLNDSRILCASDDKTLKAIGLNNNIDGVTIEFIPEDKKKGLVKSFKIIDNRIK